MNNWFILGHSPCGIPASSQRPTTYHVVDHLPRTPSGKLLRRDLTDTVPAEAGDA